MKQSAQLISALNLSDGTYMEVYKVDSSVCLQIIGEHVPLCEISLREKDVAQIGNALLSAGFLINREKSAAHFCVFIWVVKLFRGQYFSHKDGFESGILFF